MQKSKDFRATVIRRGSKSNLILNTNGKIALRLCEKTPKKHVKSLTSLERYFDMHKIYSKNKLS